MLKQTRDTWRFRLVGIGIVFSMLLIYVILAYKVS